MSFDFKERRAQLVRQVGQPVLLIGGLENAHHSFYQESSFFYFTGINEPGLACLITPDGEDTLFVPTYVQSRLQWHGSVLEPTPELAERCQFAKVLPLGAPCPGYRLLYFSPLTCWSVLHETIEALVTGGARIGTIMENELLVRFFAEKPTLKAACFDIMPVVSEMRRRKDAAEIEATIAAVAETDFALQRAIEACVIPGITEYEVVMGIQSTFLFRGVREAFPTIVAGGYHATTLHHTCTTRPFKRGDCVVIDLGASVSHLCSDVTRTIPVSGTFTPRQRDIYQAVLETQRAVAELARPGMYLFNADQPEKSLNQIAKKLLESRGFGDYWVHGIGHFLGLDVHDVGDTKIPLQVGDLITIEPGVYIKDENCGVRIEDDYLIGEHETVCLTSAIPQEASDIEELVQSEIARLHGWPSGGCSSGCCRA